MKRFLRLITCLLMIAPLLVQAASAGRLMTGQGTPEDRPSAAITMNHAAHIGAMTLVSADDMSKNEGQPQRHHASHGGLCALFCANTMAQSMPEPNATALTMAQQKWARMPRLALWRGFAEISPPPPRRA